MQTTYLDLPPELVDHIFRCGCILSTSFCRALCQTSSWTRKLALPYLYSTMIIKNHRTTKHIWGKVVEHPTASLDPDFPVKNYIRSLYIDDDLFDAIMDIFRDCNRLSRLALKEEIFSIMVIVSSMQGSASFRSFPQQAILCKPDIHLLIFRTCNVPFSNPSLNSPLFVKVTHLRYGQMASYSDYMDMFYFKRLTHIAIPYHCPWRHSLPDLLRIFDHLPMIFLVVVLLTDQLSEEELQDALRWVVDVRKRNYRVSAVLSKLEDLQMEWEEEARYGVSIWDKAALFTQSLSS